MRRLWRQYREGRLARARLLELLDLHRPQWDNCINACCSGEKCIHRSQVCAHDYAPWPCETVLIIGQHVARSTPDVRQSYRHKGIGHPIEGGLFLSADT